MNEDVLKGKRNELEGRVKEKWENTRGSNVLQPTTI
jgi:uncharacterized protein YjbJ (UPF0337 family)